jgi:hypothetical protein
MSRLAATLALLSVLIAPALFAPGAALAQDPGVATIENTSASIVAPNCQVIVDVSWISSDIPGPSVTVSLYRSVGGELVLASQHQRTGNDELDQLMDTLATPDSVNTYQVLVTKGPKHVVAASETFDVTCPAL